MGDRRRDGRTFAALIAILLTFFSHQLLARRANARLHSAFINRRGTR
jgi:hypothetical protein